MTIESYFSKRLCCHPQKRLSRKYIYCVETLERSVVRGSKCVFQILMFLFHEQCIFTFDRSFFCDTKQMFIFLYFTWFLEEISFSSVKLQHEHTVVPTAIHYLSKSCFFYRKNSLWNCHSNRSENLGAGMLALQINSYQEHRHKVEVTRLFPSKQMLGRLLYIFYIVLFCGDRFPKNCFLYYYVFEEIACQVKITPLTMM
jgi:hypothetical protein